MTSSDIWLQHDQPICSVRSTDLVFILEDVPTWSAREMFGIASGFLRQARSSLKVLSLAPAIIKDHAARSQWLLSDGTSEIHLS